MLAQCKASGASEILDCKWASWPTRGLGAEYTAMEAFAHACTGDSRTSLTKLEASAGLASQIEADALRVWASAIVRQPAGADTDALVAAFDHAYVIGHIDSIVLACRAYPPTL